MVDTPQAQDQEQIKKIRRRIEDFLRKASAEIILQIAAILKIKTD